jgi:hypothetical protein
MSEPADNRLATEADKLNREVNATGYPKVNRAKPARPRTRTNYQAKAADLESRIKNAVIVLEGLKANEADTLPPLVRVAVKILTGEG